MVLSTSVTIWPVMALKALSFIYTLLHSQDDLFTLDRVSGTDTVRIAARDVTSKLAGRGALVT